MTDVQSIGDALTAPWHDGWGDVDASPDAGWFIRQLEGRTDELFEQFGQAAPVLGQMLAIAEGSQVLDVGCGVGDLLALIAKVVGRSGRLCGIDRSEAMLAAARGRYPDFDLQHADASSLPLVDSTFDAAVANLVLEHVPDPLQVLREMVRVVRPGGRILVRDTDWTSLKVDSDDDEIFARIVDQFNSAIRHPSIAREFPTLLAQAGLIDVQVITSEQLHRGSPPRELWTIIRDSQSRLGDPATTAWLRAVEQRAWHGTWLSRCTTHAAWATVGLKT